MLPTVSREVRVLTSLLGELKNYVVASSGILVEKNTSAKKTRCRFSQRRHFHQTRTLALKSNVLPLENDTIRVRQVDVPDYKEDSPPFRGMQTDFPCLTRKYDFIHFMCLFL